MAVPLSLLGTGRDRVTADVANTGLPGTGAGEEGEGGGRLRIIEQQSSPCALEAIMDLETNLAGVCVCKSVACGALICLAAWSRCMVWLCGSVEVIECSEVAIVEEWLKAIRRYKAVFV